MPQVYEPKSLEKGTPSATEAILDAFPVAPLERRKLSPTTGLHNLVYSRCVGEDRQDHTNSSFAYEVAEDVPSTNKVLLHQLWRHYSSIVEPL